MINKYVDVIALREDRSPGKSQGPAQASPSFLLGIA
jgi:hypothetical protein